MNFLTHRSCRCGQTGAAGLPRTKNLCINLTSWLTSYKGKSLGSSAVHGTYVCIDTTGPNQDTTSPNQDTTSPGAKQLAFWTQLAYNFRHCHPVCHKFLPQRMYNHQPSCPSAWCPLKHTTRSMRYICRNDIVPVAKHKVNFSSIYYNGVSGM